MYAWFYKGSDLLQLPIVSLVVFMAVFGAVVVRVLRSRDLKNPHNAVASLPLDDGDTPNGGSHV